MYKHNQPADSPADGFNPYESASFLGSVTLEEVPPNSIDAGASGDTWAAPR